MKGTLSVDLNLPYIFFHFVCMPWIETFGKQLLSLTLAIPPVNIDFKPSHAQISHTFYSYILNNLPNNFQSNWIHPKGLYDTYGFHCSAILNTSLIRWHSRGWHCDRFLECIQKGLPSSIPPCCLQFISILIQNSWAWLK